MRSTEESPRPFVTPTPDIPKEAFPHTGLRPAGCDVLAVNRDHGRFEVAYHQATYATRDMDGGTEDLDLYVLVPRTRDPEQARRYQDGYPCVVYVQGSHWGTQNLYSHFSDLVRLAEQGYVVACPRLREAAGAPFLGGAQDVRSALSFLRAHAAEYEVDANRMALWGDDSGAHLALIAGFTADLARPSGADGGQPVSGAALPPLEDLLARGAIEVPAFTVEGIPVELVPDDAAEPCPVRCIVDWYAPTVLDELNCAPCAFDYTTPECSVGVLLGGRSAVEHPAWAAAASPLSYIPSSAARSLPPVLIMHGDRDPIVSFEQSALLYEALVSAGQEGRLVCIPDAAHGCNGFRSDEALAAVSGFLGEHLA